MKGYIAFFGFFILCFYGASAQRHKIDSLKALLLSDKADSAKVAHLNVLSRWYKHINQYDTAIQFNLEAIELCNKLNLEKSLCDSYGNLGILFKIKGNISKALEYYYKALKIAERRGDKASIADNYVRIGIIYDEQADLQRALKNYSDALKIYEAIGNRERITLTLGNIGNIYFSRQDFIKALDYYKRALKTDEELNNTEGMMFTLGYIGMAYTEQAKILEKNLKPGSDSLYNQALSYYLRALKIAEKAGDKQLMCNWNGNIGSLYTSLKKYNEAEKYLIRSIALADSVGTLEEKMQFEILISELYSAKQDYRKSLEHFKLYTRAKDSIFNMEKNKELTRHELNYEFEKKEANTKAEQDKKSRLHKMIIAAVACVLAFTLIILLVIFRSLRVTRRQKSIIERQKLIVDEKQKEIIDSIHYARRIQRALLPSEKYFEKKFSGLAKK